MGSTQHWDDPERMAQRQEAMRDPNPHLRAGRDPYLGARLAREVADLQRAEVPSMPGNFLPVEERATTTTPAGESAYVIADPRPDARVDATTERLRRAMFAREVADRSRLSGSHDERANTRHFDVPPTFTTVKRLDAAGRVDENEINWASAHRQPD